MDNKKRFLQGALCGALVTFIIIGAGYTGIRLSANKSNTDTTVKMERKLHLIDTLLDKYFLFDEDKDQDKMLEGVYTGYVSGLEDPYTVYYTEKKAKELMESLSGKYSGVGAVLSQDNNSKAVTITSVYEESPAEKAGLMAGDIIYQVDEHEITNQDLTEIVSWIRGEKGTDVTLQVIRDNEDLAFTATRDIVKVKTVQHKMLENQIGYLSVSEFDDVTYQQFSDALTDLENQGMQGLVIDLRNNPGGNLQTVVDMLKLILPKGVVVSMKDNQGKETEYTGNGDTPFDKPMAVLMNGFSASASEIFAGAVQDYGIAKIVGTQSYGKGVVQNIFDLGDGSKIKVTIAEYFLPSGRSINKKGITPDVEVKYEKSEDNPEADNQLDAAVEALQQ